MKKNKSLLAMHDQSIWQNKDGMWCTHFVNGKKRTLIKRGTKEELGGYIIERYRKLYRACDDLEILCRSPHKIRKTYATKLIYFGVYEEVVKSLLGHNDIMTTRRNYVIAIDNPDYLRN